VKCLEETIDDTLRENEVYAANDVYELLWRWTPTRAQQLDGTGYTVSALCRMMLGCIAVWDKQPTEIRGVVQSEEFKELEGLIDNWEPYQGHESARYEIHRGKARKLISNAVRKWCT